MNELALNDISVTARILGAAFYYSPDQVPDIIELLASGEWVSDWHYGSEEQK
ncbi:Tat proofreading chaperone DmsD, partial [Providencia alcalifaciens]